MNRSFSGKFVLRIPSWLHRALSEEALKAGSSLNDTCGLALENSLKKAKGLNSRGEYSRAIDKVRKRWEKEVLGLVLFGSKARGSASEESDTDLLIVLRSECRISRSLYKEWDRLFGKARDEKWEKISPHFVQAPNESAPFSSLWLEVALDGIVLWEENFSVSHILARIRHKIAFGEVSRAESHGQGYWRLR